MEKTNLTEAQSLELITSMINDTRNRLARNSGTPFLIWGYTMIAMFTIVIILQMLLEGNWVYFNLATLPLYLTPLFALILTKVLAKKSTATPNNSKSIKILWIFAMIQEKHLLAKYLSQWLEQTLMDTIILTPLMKKE